MKARIPFPIVRFTGLLIAVAAAPSARCEDDQTAAALRDALLFHASFDTGPDADFARGDRVLYHVPSHDQRDDIKAGLPESGEIALVEVAGRPGRALRFLKPKSPIALFKAEKNFPELQPGWSATLSFWLSVDPAGDLAPGFCDPVQVTSKQWDDAAIFVEFEKRPQDIPFRLGVYADKSVWNPQGRKWEDISAAEKPLATVGNPPFAKDRWTHVAVVIERFNTGEPDGLARLYLDGKEAGQISRRTQTFTWDPGRAFIMLGLGYAGLMDDFACFNRALTTDEITRLHSLSTGLSKVHRKD